MADNQSKKDSKVLKADQTPAKKEKKKEKDSKPGVLKRIGKFLREVKSELKKVIWPTPKQTAKNTGIVLVCCGAIGVCIWIFDWLVGTGVQALILLVRGL